MYKIVPFIESLWKLVNDERTENIIKWVNPSAFEITDINLLELLLPSFFKHNKYSSFARQLNLYGFERSKTSQNRMIWSHPIFLQGRHDLLKKIRRKSKNSQSVQILPLNNEFSHTKTIFGEMDQGQKDKELIIKKMRKELEVSNNKAKLLEILVYRIYKFFSEDKNGKMLEPNQHFKNFLNRNNDIDVKSLLDYNKEKTIDEKFGELLPKNTPSKNSQRSIISEYFNNEILPAPTPNIVQYPKNWPKLDIFDMSKNNLDAADSEMKSIQNFENVHFRNFNFLKAFYMSI
ncbi:hypothetical protein MHBO_002463 [Bonamia ostreae]|uniref:HSF-type DNA-binding domain-containing protein n=1 Tax=Bonamia ostreae TaxID=126728 RepID=A0ABV2AMD0_9EUKA